MTDTRSDLVDHVAYNVAQRQYSDNAPFRKQARINMGFWQREWITSDYTDSINFQQKDIEDASTTVLAFNPTEPEKQVIFKNEAEYHFWFNSGPVYAEDSNLQTMHYRVYTAGSSYLSPWILLKNGSSINTRIDWQAYGLPDTEHPETDNVIFVEFDTPLQNGSSVYLRVMGTRMKHQDVEET